MIRKTVVCATVALGLLGAVGAPIAYAATFQEETPFTQAAFAKAQEEGKPILVHVTASWCSTCAAQKPIIDKLHAEAKFKPIVIFNINFDTEKKLLHKFDVEMQSTLIVYKGKTEEGRSTGETQPAAIQSLLDKIV